MAVVVQELIEGDSPTVSIYLKGEPLKIEGLVMIGGSARIGERRRMSISFLKGEAVRIEDQRFVPKNTPPRSSHLPCYITFCHNCCKFSPTYRNRLHKALPQSTPCKCGMPGALECFELLFAWYGLPTNTLLCLGETLNLSTPFSQKPLDPAGYAPSETVSPARFH
jgi:hypothetical protein